MSAWIAATAARWLPATSLCAPSMFWQKSVEPTAGQGRTSRSDDAPSDSCFSPITPWRIAAVARSSGLRSHPANSMFL